MEKNLSARVFGGFAMRPPKAAVSGATHRAGPGDPSASGVFVALLGLMFLLRHAMLGDPDFHVDEQFYFVVADRMWAGDLPYVDIWDRKPIGLFLIYAALRPLSGDSMIAIQLAGHLFNALTALVIWDLSSRHLGRWKAILPAALYGVWMGAFGGANGQSPVFHNLMVALAFWLLLRAWRDERRGDVFLAGLGALALIGLAIQIKYTPIFPGLVVGLGFMWLEYDRRRDVFRLGLRAAAWATAAILPTAAALGYYYSLGHFEAFVFANFQSIFLRDALQAEYLKGLVAFMVIRGLPLYCIAVLGAFAMVRSAKVDAADRIVFAWLATELVILILIGNYYDHYALPLIAPLAILSGWVFLTIKPHKLVLYALVFFFGGVSSPEDLARQTETSRRAIYGLAETARPYLRHGCMFIFDGPSILYTVTQACTMTRFVYPDHLSNAVEEHALGVNTHREMARILRDRPAVIVTTNRALIPKWNAANRAMLGEALAADYRLVDHALEGAGTRHYLLWARTDLVSPNQPMLRVPARPSPPR